MPKERRGRLLKSILEVVNEAGGGLSRDDYSLLAIRK